MDRSTIISFIPDLLFATRVESIAERAGYRSINVDNVNFWFYIQDETSSTLASLQTEETKEKLLQALTLWQPALIIFDINSEFIPWKDWVGLIKSSTATRRFPVLCFGSHKNTQVIKTARSIGTDRVVTRSQFVNELTVLIRIYVRLPDIQAINQACNELLSEKAICGLELFNQFHFFEAHEFLEEVWNEDVTAGRELYRAILQVAVAYLQIERKNYYGALEMFWRVRQWITHFPEKCKGIAVQQLRIDVETVFEKLVSLGEECIQEFDLHLFKPEVFFTPEN